MNDLEGSLAEVAVAVPFADSLTYRLPVDLQPLARLGMRVRVPLGRRSATGLLIERHERLPEGFALREVESLLDAEPVLPADLIALARFTAAYYLVPLGEVFRGILPSDLPAWGRQRVGLTDAGAFAEPRSEKEGRVVSALREKGRISVAELQRCTGLEHLSGLLEDMARAGRVSLEEGRSAARGRRYASAVELVAQSQSELLEACGKSPKAREIVDFLVRVERPATVAELEEAVEVSAAVIRRLVDKGVLRRFVQVERLSLDRHFLADSAAPSIELRLDQQAALIAIERALESGETASFLLAGVTGSGKTEVYLRAAEKALALGRTVILLVPEIALVPALARAAHQRFGDMLAILHSALGGPERHNEWERIRKGQARVVLGPRSAVFAPVSNLGLIVVDEEQDSSYKQDSVPRYNGRDLALVRGRENRAVAVLISATPSLETRHNVAAGRFRALALTARAGQGAMPEGILVDLRREPVSRLPGELQFSGRLIAEIQSTLNAGDQVVLLRNRRGYSPVLLCRACGEDLRCEACGLPRTFHRREKLMVCHYCGSKVPAPSRCPTCSQPALEPMGAGTERVEERLHELFPGTAVEVLDRDAVHRPGGAAAVIERFLHGQGQILVGTQMVSKGHHFPRVVLTGVLNADAYLGFPDFRAVEKTYTLLTQLAGRSGRGERPGKVVIQTFHPDHYAIRTALENDDAGFAAEELRFRRVFHYPPFTRMVQLLVRDTNRARAELSIGELAADLASRAESAGVRISGPAPAPLERLRNEWRFQLLLRATSGQRLRQLVAAATQRKMASELVIDVDPYQLL